MRQLLGGVLLSLFLCAGVNADVIVKFTVTVTSLNKGGFAEFKIESDQKGEQATGHLIAAGESRTLIRNMGNAKQNIWYWWDTLDGEADLKIELTGAPGKAVTLVELHCKHNGKGEVNVDKTRENPLRHGVDKHYRLNPNLGPHIVPNSSGANTHIKDADSEPRDPPGGKTGLVDDWDVIGE